MNPHGEWLNNRISPDRQSHCKVEVCVTDFDCERILIDIPDINTYQENNIEHELRQMWYSLCMYVHNTEYFIRGHLKNQRLFRRIVKC